MSQLEPDRTARVSTLELFVDLVFVFTITQLTAVLVDRGGVAAIARIGAAPIIPLRQTPFVKHGDHLEPACEHGTWTFAGSDSKRGASKWRCPTGECSPKSRWIKADRLHPLVPRETKRWRDLYRGRASVERELGRLKHEYGLVPIRVHGLERFSFTPTSRCSRGSRRRSPGRGPFRSRRNILRGDARGSLRTHRRGHGRVVSESRLHARAITEQFALLEKNAKFVGTEMWYPKFAMEVLQRAGIVE